MQGVIKKQEATIGFLLLTHTNILRKQLESIDTDLTPDDYTLDYKVTNLDKGKIHLNIKSGTTQFEYNILDNGIIVELNN